MIMKGVTPSLKAIFDLPWFASLEHNIYVLTIVYGAKGVASLKGVYFIKIEVISPSELHHNPKS
jgi:hypothetical protein